MTLAQVSMTHYAPRCELVVDGAPLPLPAAYAITRVQVTQQMNQSYGFDFTLQDELRGGQYTWLGHPLFQAGRKVTISMGYSLTIRPLLTGRSQNVDVVFGQDGPPTITVQGADHVHRFMTSPSPTHVFRNKTDSDIVWEIAQAAGLRPEVQRVDQDPAPSKTKQGGRSYAEFIEGLALTHGFEFGFTGSRLFFRPAEGKGPPVAVFAWGNNILSFHSTLSTAHALTAVVVRGWDAQAKRPIEVRVDAGGESPAESGQQLCSQFTKETQGEVVREITDHPVDSPEEARAIATSALEQSASEFITGSLEVLGAPDLEPGLFVRLEGLGPWCSGTHRIQQAVHTFSANSYRTRLEVSKRSI